MWVIGNTGALRSITVAARLWLDAAWFCSYCENAKLIVAGMRLYK
jgi:hypothetical protein